MYEGTWMREMLVEVPSIMSVKVTLITFAGGHFGSRWFQRERPSQPETYFLRLLSLDS